MATGDLIQFEICSAASLSGIAAAGTIVGDGVIARLRFQGIGASASVNVTSGTFNFWVRRPGWNTAKVYSAANTSDLVWATAIHRQPQPNSTSQLVVVVGSDLDVYVPLSEEVFAGDTVDTIAVTAGFYGACTTSSLSTGTNSSTLAYPMPQFSWAGLEWWEPWGAGGIALEGLIDHWGSRNGQPVAAVDYYGTDGTRTSTVTANSMDLSNRLTGPYRPGVYPALLPQGTLVQGEVGAGAIIYPWVGNAAWDTNSAAFDDFPCYTTPKLFPTNLDTDGSFARAGAYVSHTGAQIGTPSIGLVSAMAAYVPGTTPAYATPAALAAAGKTYNNSGARARPHNDIAGIACVIPSGRLVPGVGANMSSQTTYPGGLGLFRMVPEAGASNVNTGLTTGGGTALTIPSRFAADRIAIAPGAAGAATHTVIDMGSANGAPTAQPAKAAAGYLLLKGCAGTGNGDNTYPVISRSGYKQSYNNAFVNFGDDVANMSASVFAGWAAIHGGIIDNRTLAASTQVQSASIAGVQLWGCGLTDLVTGAAPDLKGRMVHNVRSDADHSLMGSGVTALIGQNRAIGVRGESWVNTLIRAARSSGGTAGIINGGESPIMRISADYDVSTNTDRPAIQNVNITYVTAVGARRNGPYNEAGGGTVAAVRVEKRIRERFPAYSERNCKADLMDADLAGTANAQSGIRTGIMAYRYGTSLLGIVTGDASANSDSPGPGSWLGEVVFPGSEDNVGFANMFVSDTSLAGSNSYASQGNYEPLAKLKNRVPAGRAATKYDLLGRLRLNTGAGAAGAIEAVSAGLGAGESFTLAGSVAAGALRGVGLTAAVAVGDGAGAGALRGLGISAALTVDGSVGTGSGGAAISGAIGVTGAVAAGALRGIAAAGAFNIDAAVETGSQGSPWRIVFAGSVGLGSAGGGAAATFAATARAAATVYLLPPGLVVGRALAATGVASASIVAGFQSGFNLAASAIAAPALAATLQTGRLLAASGLAVASVAATLSTTIRFAAAPAGVATASIFLETHVDVFAAAAAVPNLTATLATGKLLAATGAIAAASVLASLYCRPAFPFEGEDAAAIPRALQGETLDAMLWRFAGIGPGGIEAVLAANPGLADLGPWLPEGHAVALDDIAAAAATPAERQLVQLWD